MYKAFISYKFFFQSNCFDNLFPPNLLRMTQYNQFCLICNFSNLFPPKWLRINWNGQFCQIHNFSNLFPLKQLRITVNGQFCSINNFSNIFPPKWLTITWNGHFHSIHKFSSKIGHCGSFSSWKWLKKLHIWENLAPPPKNEKFWDLAKNKLLWWKKIRKIVNQVKLAILSHSELLWQEKLWIRWNWLFWVILSNFGGKRFSDCLADHQKLNLIQKQTFHFLMPWGPFFTFWSTSIAWIAWLIIRNRM